METKRAAAVYPLAMTAVLAALMAVAAPFSVAIGPVPLSFCTLVIYLAGYLLGGRRAALATLAELLAELLATDENADRIGEIAFVPASSPINRSGVLFYNTLFDENAACHIAFGAGYPTNIKGGAKLTRAQLMEKGLNDSAIHEDVMIGAPDTRITGVRKNGEEVRIFENGEWVF